MSNIQFKMDKCPWIFLKDSDQGTLYWCERCGAIYHEDGDWDDNGPSKPIIAGRNYIECPDINGRGL